MIPKAYRKDVFVGIGIFIFALSFRLLYWAFLKQHYLFYESPSEDVLYYHEWAHEIASGQSQQSVFWGMPLYPYFLAVLYQFTLGNFFLIRFLHLILGSANCVLMHLVGRKIFGQRVGLAASLLMACNFVLIYYDWLMLPVGVVVTLSLLVVWAFLDLNQKYHPQEAFLLGILLGLSMLGDGKFILFFMGLVVLRLGGWFRQRREDLKILIPLALGVVLVLSLVLLRNRVQGGDWILISAQSGFSFYVGNNPQSDGIFDNLGFIRPTHQGQDEDQKIVAEQILRRPLTAAEVSRFWRNQGLNFMRSAPADYMKLLIRKFHLFWVEHEGAHDIDLLLQHQWKKLLDFNPFSLIVSLGLLGMILTRRGYPGGGFSNLMILSQLFFTLIFFLTTKHRASILPFLILYEAFSIFWLVEKIREKNIKPILLASLFVSFSFMVFRPVALEAKAIEFLRLSKSGTILEKRKEYGKAQEQYLKALEINPYDAQLIYNLGNVLLSQDQFDSAVSYYQRSLAMNPYHADALFNLGVAYEKLNKEDMALFYYQKVLALEPESPDTHFRLAKIYDAKGLCPQALYHYGKIIKIKPYFNLPWSDLLANCIPHRK